LIFCRWGCVFILQLLNVVFVTPQIAANVGSFGRTAIGLGARLHLVEPMGFTITDKAVKRVREQLAQIRLCFCLLTLLSLLTAPFVRHLSFIDNLP
jgi:hypothetical protein